METHELQRMRNESFRAGRASSFEELEQNLMHSAGCQFAKGQDELAKYTRELAIGIGKLALDERKRQKDFQPQFSGGL
jgi:hypothetical protein